MNSVAVAWANVSQGQCDGLSAITAEYRPLGDVRRPELWLATSAGKILRWGAGAPIATLPRRITNIAVRDGAILAQTDKRDVYLLDATSGKQRALWKQSHTSAALRAITPLGHDAVLALLEQTGHPTERSARVVRVAVGRGPDAGQLLAITQGESIVYTSAAAYADDGSGLPERRPFDGAAPTAVSHAEISSLLHADDPSGWRVHSDPTGLRVVRPDGGETVLAGAEIPLGMCFLEGGGQPEGNTPAVPVLGLLASVCWLATLAMSGTLTLWDIHSAQQIATTHVEPRSQLVRQGAGVVTAGPTGTLRWWTPTG